MYSKEALGEGFEPTTSAAEQTDESGIDGTL
jgi:hypothetical protein